MPTSGAQGVILWQKNGVILERNRKSNVFTLVLDRKENRFNPELCRDMGQALTLVEQAKHPKALVITGGSSSKFFSNGLDLAWMQANPQGTPQLIGEGVWGVLARILVLDCRTVAAINGHAFGAGLFLALSCDYRIMRTKRGYVNFPEVNLGMRLAKGFAELTKAKCRPETLREAVLTAKRYTSQEALQAGLIDAECSLEELRDKAHQLAYEGVASQGNLMNFNPKSFSQVKVELYTDAYRALTLGTHDTPSHSRL